MRREVTGTRYSSTERAVSRTHVTRSFRRIFAGMFLVLCACLSFGAFLVHAQGKNSGFASEYTCYTSIVIQPGDSLWSISKKALTASPEESGAAVTVTDADITEYTAFLMDINDLASDQIHAGQNLIVAYRE